MPRLYESFVGHGFSRDIIQVLRTGFKPLEFEVCSRRTGILQAKGAQTPKFAKKSSPLQRLKPILRCNFYVTAEAVTHKDLLGQFKS